VSGRRAREIRRRAEAVCADRGITDGGTGAYRPQVVRSPDGKTGYRFPERRLMPGPRYLARRIRKIYTRTGMYPIVEVGR
jgi:hypothetical protein